MSESHEEVLNLHSVFGLKATVTIPSATTDGAYVQMDVVVDAGRLWERPRPEEVPSETSSLAPRLRMSPGSSNR